MITLPDPKKSRDHDAGYKRYNNKEERCVKCSRQVRKDNKYYCPKLNRTVSSNYVCRYFDRKPDYIKQSEDDKRRIHRVNNSRYNEEGMKKKEINRKQIKQCTCLNNIIIGKGEPKFRQKFKANTIYYYRKLTNDEIYLVYTVRCHDYNFKASFSMEEFYKNFEVK